MERLAYTLKVKTDEVDNLMRKIHTLELRSEPRNLPDLEAIRKISIYEET